MQSHDECGRQIFEEMASLSFQVSWPYQFLTDFKKILDFAFFPLGLSNFGWGAWFPFDEGQSIIHALKNFCPKYTQKLPKNSNLLQSARMTKVFLSPLRPMQCKSLKYHLMWEKEITKPHLLLSNLFNFFLVGDNEQLKSEYLNNWAEF